MIGLVVLGLLILWLAVAAFITKAVFRRLPEKRWRVPLTVGIYLLVVALPLIDEIIGAIQFHYLCNEHSEIHVDRAKAAGRTVYLAETEDEDVRWGAIPISIQHWRYVDVVTSEPIVSWEEVYARSGLLARLLDPRAPLIFRASCYPVGKAINPITLLNELDVHQIERKDKGMRK